MLRRSYCFVLIFFMVSLSFLSAQETQKMAPTNYSFEWMKANGDEYEILVENNLENEMIQKLLERVYMQILLKSLMSSRNFETFNPEKFTLYSDGKSNISKLDFSFLDDQNEEQKRTHYYLFDYSGNVFNQIKVISSLVL